MSLWQYLAALEGYIAANSSDDDKRISASEADELWQFIQEG